VYLTVKVTYNDFTANFCGQQFMNLGNFIFNNLQETIIMAAAKRVDEIIEAALQEKLLNDYGELPPWSLLAWQKVTDLLNSSTEHQKNKNK